VKLVAGLGNPGPRYVESRHNIGFRVVDALAQRWGAAVTRYERHFEALAGEAATGGQRVLLLKPATFMNLSGRSVAAAWRFYKMAPDEVLVVHDDLDLPVGQLRLRGNGSAGGHKGMEDVLRHLGTTDVPRLRIGIGKVQRDATVEYVLSRFEPDERVVVEEAVCEAADAVECWVQRGLDTAMNQFNRRRGSGSGERPPGAPPSEGEAS
jgi:peptidyl-tRNA hydrolase, PTH1 family